MSINNIGEDLHKYFAAFGIVCLSTEEKEITMRVESHRVKFPFAALDQYPQVKKANLEIGFVPANFRITSDHEIVIEFVRPMSEDAASTNGPAR